jgi:hypothetical protein
MKSLSLLLLILVLGVSWQEAHAQDIEAPEGAVIESVDLRGLARDSLSPGLRRELDTLTGEPLNRERLTEIAARIEGEHPDVVAAVRSVARPDDRARVIILVARISDDSSLVENINARYTVESVEIRGIDESEISQSLRDRVRALVGRRLDHDEAEELSDELEADRPGYAVDRQISRGTERGRIRVVFEFSEKEGERWIPFAPSRSKFVFHEDQRGSGALDIPMGGRNHRFTAGFAFGNNDDLIEEYTGIRFRLESRRLGTERLGASLEVSRLRQDWRDATVVALAADPTIPGLYRRRVTVEPKVTVALNPYLRVTGGASITELEPLDRSLDSQMASAFVAGIDFRRRWNRPSDQRLEAGYELRSAATGLESDLVYKRHLGKARYRYERDDNTVIADVFFGGITGTAPLFERFTLGDTTTLRGWNKYDIAPAGGERVFHSSLEYRFHQLGFFLDTGSVWNRNTDPTIRLSTGFGLQADNVFITFGFPLNTDDVRATFMMGVRF